MKRSNLGMQSYFFTIILLSVAGCESSSENELSAGSSPNYCNCDDLRYDHVYNAMHILNYEDAFTGECEYRYNAEQIKELRTYVDGKMHGTAQSWHANGQLASSSEFNRNLQDGVVKKWDENGALVEHALYRNGKFVKLLSE